MSNIRKLWVYFISIFWPVLLGTWVGLIVFHSLWWFYIPAAAFWVSFSIIVAAKYIELENKKDN